MAIHVVVAGPNEAELWRGDERLAVTVLYDERLHLRIDPRADGQPWLIDATSLALGLDEAAAAIMGLSDAPRPRPTARPGRSPQRV